MAKNDVSFWRGSLTHSSAFAVAHYLPHGAPAVAKDKCNALLRLHGASAFAAAMAKDIAPRRSFRRSHCEKKGAAFYCGTICERGIQRRRPARPSLARNGTMESIAVMSVGQ